MLKNSNAEPTTNKGINRKQITAHAIGAFRSNGVLNDLKKRTRKDREKAVNRLKPPCCQMVSCASPLLLSSPALAAFLTQ